MKCDGQRCGLGQTHIASKWLFAEQVGCSTVFGLNASPGQIPSKRWRVRTLQACHSGIMWPASTGCCVELQLVASFRQPCGGLWSQEWLHGLSAPLLLHKPFSAAVLFFFVAVLADLASYVWPGTCWLLFDPSRPGDGSLWCCVGRGQCTQVNRTVASVPKKSGDQSSHKSLTLLLLT